MLLNIGNVGVFSENKILNIYNRFIKSLKILPSEKRKIRYKSIFQNLNEYNLINKLDLFLLFSARDEQAARVNLITCKEVTSVNSPNFSLDQGFIGNGISGVGDSYISTGIIASEAKNFKRNDAYMGIWSLTNSSNNSGLDIGCAGSYLNPRVVAGSMAVRANFTTAASVQTYTVPDSLGYFSWLRSNSSDFQFRRNGISLDTRQASTDALSANEITILKVDSSYSNRRIAAAVIGGNLTSEDDANIYKIINEVWLTGLSGDYN